MQDSAEEEEDSQYWWKEKACALRLNKTKKRLQQGENFP